MKTVTLVIVSILWALAAGVVPSYIPPSRHIVKEETPSNDFRGILCDACLKSMIGIEYNVEKFREAAHDMINKDCQSFFEPDGDEIAECISYLRRKLDHYIDNLEPSLEPRKVCRELRVCENFNEI